MGKIMSPITIRNNGDIMKAIKRIMTGPLTMIVIMADWCGHCQTLKPKYNNIMANSRHTIQNVAVDETMADQFNRALTKSIVGSEPLTVKGFPSLLLLDKNGQVKSAVPNDVTIIKSTTENLGNVPSINNENPKPVKQNSITQQNTEEEEGELVNNLSVEPVEQDITMSRNAPVIKVNTSNVQDSQEEYVPTSMNKNVSGKVSPLSPLPISKQSNIASPPAPEVSMGADVIIPSRKSPAEELSQKGGSLYGSIASAAYKLAPPAVLMAAAAAMMKRSSRNKKKGNRTKKSRRV
jgi:thiol-disulfide isomerase/thioredoxin